MGTMHAAALEKSRRLQRLLGYLQKAGSLGATTLEISRDCNLMNAATWASMLRRSGHPITCKYVGETGEGARLYRYWLTAALPQAPPPPDMFGPTPAPAAAAKAVPMTEASWGMAYCGFCNGDRTTGHKAGCPNKV